MQLEVIKLNSSGELVELWQFFLTGQGHFHDEVSGTFDDETKAATIEFQKKQNLQPDGVVGNKSFGVAMQLGFGATTDKSVDKSSINWPAKPAFQPLVSNDERQALFGPLQFVHEPLPTNRENIRITNNWDKDNIGTIKVPQLLGITRTGNVSFHKKAHAQFLKLWADWEKAGLLHLVLTWDGGYTPRFVRGSTKTLSNHAFGTAFDINVAWNGLGATPALVGQKGSVRELVTIANKNGFYWGGHFTRLDGMHFEVAKII